MKILPEKPRSPIANGRKVIQVGRPTAAFSLIEILVVIAIIGMMAGAVVIHLDNVLERAKIDAATQFVDNGIKVSLTAYKVHVGRYPSTEEGLAALRAAPSGAGKKWGGPYIEDGAGLVDPWGNPYHYRSPGTHNPRSYDVWSGGSDTGEEGDDIGNWGGDDG